MTEKQLKEVEKQLEDIDELREGLNPRIGALKDQKAELESEMSDAVLDDALGLAKNNGKIENLREQIKSLDKKISDAERLRASMESKQGGLRAREQELKLKVFEAEIRDLAPQVSRLADQYLEQRESIRLTVNEYNEKQKRAESLWARIHELRRLLETGQRDCGDLPSIRNLNFGVLETGITVDQLRGQKRW